MLLIIGYLVRWWRARRSGSALPAVRRTAPRRVPRLPTASNGTLALLAHQVRYDILTSLRLIKSENEIPPHNNWFGWMQLVYDPQHDCFIGKVNDKFFAFRYVPAK